MYEDESDYCNAWEEKTALTENLPSCQKTEFKFTNAKDLDGLPYTANVDVYSGGGYVYRLNAAARQIRKDLLELQQQHWVNNHTRAIFLEFSTYNANVKNLELIGFKRYSNIFIISAQSFYNCHNCCRVYPRRGHSAVPSI